MDTILRMILSVLFGRQQKRFDELSPSIQLAAAAAVEATPTSALLSRSR